MHRYHYRAQSRPDTDPEAFFRAGLPALEARMERQGARQLSLFRYGAMLFLYYESGPDPVEPQALFPDAAEVLEYWPGEDSPRCWAPMTDIFHYQQPVDESHWRRTNPAARPYARLARLDPELISSYIFYHYQYQEERPGDGDKYGVIALHENLMFFYSESPATVEPAPYAGKLSTANTPSDWMGTLNSHFLLWEGQTGSARFWLEIPLLIRA